MSGNRPATEHGNAISVIPGSAAIDNPDNPSSRSSLADTDDSHRSDHDAVDELTTAIQSVSVVDLDRDDAREDEDNADLDLFKSNDQNVGITEKFKGAEPADEYATTKAAVVEAEDVIDCISNSEIEDGTASTFTSSSCSSESDVLSCSSADDADDETATTFSIDDIARMLRDGTFRDVVVMTGAGISTAAGIPDFRTPGTGLYDNLQRYKLPYAEAIFDLAYFRRRPEPFFALAKELFPGDDDSEDIGFGDENHAADNVTATRRTYRPTVAHYFIRLLAEKGVLRRLYTQNIDALERRAGIDEKLLVEAHGTFHTARCLGCRRDYEYSWIKSLIMRDEIPRCTACTSLVKPNITFFGEQLPTRFHDCADLDVPHACDLLLVMGTSLAVQPFASLVDGVRAGVPRVLINRGHAGKVRFPRPRRKLDVAVEGDCDDGCWLLAELIGWRADLEELVEAGNSTHGDKRPRRMEKKQ